MKIYITHTLFLLLSFITSSLTAATIAADSIKLVPQVTNRHNNNSRISFSPDNKLMAVARRGITVWNTEGYFIVKHVPEIFETISFLIFVDNGKKLIVASKEDRKISVYDLMLDKIVKEFHLGQWGVLSLDVSSDGKKMMVGTTGGNLEIFELDSGNLVGKIETGNGRLVQAVFVQGDKKIISIGENSKDTIKLYDSSGAFLKKHTCEPGIPINAFTLAQDRKSLALGYGPKIQVLDTDLNVTIAGALRAANRNYLNFVKLALSSDGRMLAALGNSWVTTFSTKDFSKISDYPLILPADFFKSYRISKEEDLLADAPNQWSTLIFSPDSKTLAVTTESSPPRLLDPYSGALVESLGRVMSQPQAAALTPANRAVLSAPPAKLWELKDSVRSLNAQRIYTTQIMSGMNGKYVFTNSNRTINVTDLEGTVVKQFPTEYDCAFDINDSKGLLAYAGPMTKPGEATGRTIEIVSLKDWETVVKIPVGKTAIGNILLAPGGDLISWNSGIWDIKKGVFTRKFDESILGVSFVRSLSATGKWEEIRLTDFEGVVKKTIRVTGYPSAFKFAPSGEVLAFVDSTNTIQLWKLPEFKLIGGLTGHNRRIKRLDFSGDGHLLLSTSDDGIITLWNIDNSQQVSLISREDDWLMYTPDGYFDGSAHSGDMLAVVDGLTGYAIDQFAATMNRPDLILERMGLATPEEISYFRDLHLKRLKTLGLTESSLPAELHVPEAKIVKTARSGKFIDIDFHLSDTKYPLKLYNIYINEVPIHGADGKEIRGRHYNGNEKIELTNGRNKIELSVINEVGAESFRALAYADYEGTEKGELYYLAFGISEYKNPELNLSYADKDAKDLGSVMQEMRHGYSHVNVKLLLNSDATAENIIKTRDFLKDAKVDDTVILFAAGHGGYDKGRNSKYYFLPYEADPKSISATGVDFETIGNLLNNIKPRAKLFLLDTCESGELDEETFYGYYASAEKNKLNPRTYRKPGMRGAENLQVHPKSLRTKDRFIYNNLSRRSGAVVFSSSRGNELSYESSSIENGFFSYEIKNALRNKAADTSSNNRIDTTELLYYVAKAVAERTGGLQHPTIDRDNKSVEFSLPRATNINSYSMPNLSGFRW